MTEQNPAGEHPPATDGAAPPDPERDDGAAPSPPGNGATGKATSTRKRSKNRPKRANRGPVQRTGARVDRGAPRHQARILAMQALFEHDMTDHGLQEILARLADEEGEAVPPPVGEHAERLARGVDGRLSEIDPYIAAAAPMYPVSQLASIDRGVLRLAVYELLFERDVPFRVVINEAVEIAKRFGGPSSGRFVNGVLGTIVDRIPPATSTSASTGEGPPAEPGSSG